MIQSDIAISVNCLEKSFKKLKTLRKINYTVQKGHIFALLGWKFQTTEEKSMKMA